MEKIILRAELRCDCGTVLTPGTAHEYRSATEHGESGHYAVCKCGRRVRVLGSEFTTANGRGGKR